MSKNTSFRDGKLTHKYGNTPMRNGNKNSSNLQESTRSNNGNSESK